MSVREVFLNNAKTDLFSILLLINFFLSYCFHILILRLFRNLLIIVKQYEKKSEKMLAVFFFYKSTYFFLPVLNYKADWDRKTLVLYNETVKGCLFTDFKS